MNISSEMFYNNQISEKQKDLIRSDSDITAQEGDMEYFILRREKNTSMFLFIVVNCGQNVMCCDLCANILEAITAMHSYLMNEYLPSFKEA